MIDELCQVKPGREPGLNNLNALDIEIANVLDMIDGNKQLWEQKHCRYEPYCTDIN